MPRYEDVLQSAPPLDPLAHKCQRARAALDERIGLLLTGEQTRVETIEEFRSRPIDELPSLSQREALERSKVQLLQRRKELCEELVSHAAECEAELRLLHKNQTSLDDVREAVTTKLREAGFPVSMRKGEFVDARGHGVPYGLIVDSHPGVVDNEERRRAMTEDVNRWHEFIEDARRAVTDAEAAIEAERERILAIS